MNNLSERKKAQLEIGQQFVNNLITSVEGYISRIPIEDNSFIEESKLKKYYDVQEIINYWYTKYCERLEDISNYDIRFFLVNGIFQILIYYKGKMIDKE